MSISLNNHENRIVALEKRGLTRRVLFDSKSTGGNKPIQYNKRKLSDNINNYDILCIVTGDHLIPEGYEDLGYTFVDVSMLKYAPKGGITCTNLDTNKIQGSDMCILESFTADILDDTAVITGTSIQIHGRNRVVSQIQPKDISTSIIAIIGYKWGGGINLGTLLQRLLVYIKTYSKLSHLQFLEVK